MVNKARKRIDDRLKQQGLFKAEDIVAYNLSLFDSPQYETRGLENE